MIRLKLFKRETPSLLQGPIWKPMLLFVLPVAASSILQQLFTSADMAVVGRFEGKQALAAVGGTSTIVNLFIEFFLGLSIGANVLISRHIGEGNEKSANDTVHTAIASALLCGGLIALIGIPLTERLLTAMKTPADILPLSAIYLKIYFAGMPVYMLGNFAAAIFRSRGEPQKPLYCLCAGGVINVALNLLFVVGFHWGVAGVAAATVAANMLSAGLMVYLLTREKGCLCLDIRRIRLHGVIFLRLLKLGLPSGFLGSVFSISNVCVQSAINSLGADVMSASSAAVNVEIYIQFVGNAFAQAATTFTGQNYGAKNYDRCRRVTRIAMGLCVSISTVLSAAAYLAGPALLGIFVADAAVIALAMIRMKYTLLFKPIQAMMDIMVGCLQGYGYTFVPALISIFGVCGLRLLWLYTLFAAAPSLDRLMLVYPITQGIAVLLHSACYFRLHRKFSISS